jgi:hypothetical protein
MTTDGDKNAEKVAGRDGVGDPADDDETSGI